MAFNRARFAVPDRSRYRKRAAQPPAPPAPPEPPPPTTPVLSDTRHDATEAVTWGVRVGAAWTWRLLLLLLGAYVLIRIFARIELVAFSFVIALFLTAVLHPLDARLDRALPRPRSLSAALSVLIGIAFLGGIGYFVSWQIANHADQLGAQLTTFVNKAQNWLKTGPFHLKSADLSKITDSIANTIKNHQGEVLSSAVQTVRTVAEGFGAFLLILLSTFFLLRDGDAIWRWVLRMFPRPAQGGLDRAGRVGWHTLGGYMRGQLLIALFHGISVFIVLLVLRVPLSAALGVLIFLGSFIPLVGLTVSGAVCVIVAMLEHGFTAGIVVLVAIVVLVQLEAHALQPLIMSRTVEVHPLAIALSVITGTTIAGIPGALLAVPLVAFLNSSIHALRGTPARPVGGADFPVAEREEPGGDPVEPTDAAEADAAGADASAHVGLDEGRPDHAEP
jgi:predicted PurR-regulated permease PerM